MKKLFYAIAALAVVASCAKVAEVETNVEPKDGKNLVHMTIRAEAPQTKTYIDQTGTDTYQPQWLASDKLGVFFDTVKGTKDAELINTAASGTKGEFLGDVSISTGSHKIYAYSPASATISKASDTKVVFTVLDEQYPDSDTFDSDADIVVAKAKNLEIDSDIMTVDEDLAFGRILSTVKVTVNKANASDFKGETINKIVISSAFADANLTGTISWDFENATSEVVSGKSSVTAELLYPVDFGTPIFILVNPTTVKATSDKPLTITVYTNAHKITKTITSLPKDLVFPKAGIAALNIGTGGAVVENYSSDAQALPYSESFDSSIGNFWTDKTQIGSSIDVWTLDDANHYMKGTAYVSSTKDRYETEAWLFSPWIDLTSVSGASLSFEHVSRYTESNDQVTLWVITDVANADWEQLTIPTYSSGTNWTFVESGAIELSAYAGHKVMLGFKYISDGTSDGTGTWEIKNVSVIEKSYSTLFTMDSDAISVEVGKTKNNHVTVNSGATITYDSDDESIATVSADGTITGVAEGSTYINVHVAANGFYPAADDVFEVTVIPAIAYKSFSWDLSKDNTVSASEASLNWAYRGTTMVLTKDASATNANNFYGGDANNRTSTRFYSNQKLTITPYSSSSIGYVEFTATTSGYAKALMNSTWSNAEASMADPENGTVVTVTPVNGANSFYASIGATCGFTDVTVYYTGELKVPASHAVSFTQPTGEAATAGCSFTVEVDGNALTSGDLVEENATVTLTATAGTGYKFTSWTVTGATVSGNTATATFVMGESDVTVSAAFEAVGNLKTYQHVFTAKPAVGNNTSLSGVDWNIAASELNGYNSGNYAGVQIGTSKKDGSLTLTSSSDWSYNGATKITEVRLWLNLGGTSVTPTVTINGKAATSDGTVVVKNASAGSDWTKATKVTFTPAADGDTGVVVINIETVKAGYICAMEIDCE